MSDYQRFAVKVPGPCISPELLEPACVDRGPWIHRITVDEDGNFIDEFIELEGIDK